MYLISNNLRKKSKYLYDEEGFHGYTFTKQGEADFSKLQGIIQKNANLKQIDVLTIL